MQAYLQGLYLCWKNSKYKGLKQKCAWSFQETAKKSRWLWKKRAKKCGWGRVRVHTVTNSSPSPIPLSLSTVLIAPRPQTWLLSCWSYSKEFCFLQICVLCYNELKCYNDYYNLKGRFNILFGSIIPESVKIVFIRWSVHIFSQWMSE